MRQLQDTLKEVDGCGYRAYKVLKGRYCFPEFDLYIDHIQGDPFAAPSKFRIRMGMDHSGIPKNLFSNPIRKIACQDYLTRVFFQEIQNLKSRGEGSGKSGVIEIDCGGQEVLERTSMEICDDWVEARIEVGLPAAGRRILGREAARILLEILPSLARSSLKLESLQESLFEEFVQCVENQEAIRAQLQHLDLIAFVADGSSLPRISGHRDLPLNEGAVSFHSPKSLRVTLELPHFVSLSNRQTQVSGMGIPKGVTLIVGGGYHGKSTLLQAIERCVYPHIPGDGREYVVTDSAAVKIRAEDGRRVERVNISPFISRLPYGKDTIRFQSEDASGSTSQAANLMEALEAGARALLMDEDTCATNFMIRDARMQTLVEAENEPITPLIDRIKELYWGPGVSTILVMGGCGDYLELADQVLFFKNYELSDVTSNAREICSSIKTQRRRETSGNFPTDYSRVPCSDSFDPSRGKSQVKIQVRGLDSILFGKEDIDLRQVEQVADGSQLQAIGFALYLLSRAMNTKKSLAVLLDELEYILEKEGLRALCPYRRTEEHPGRLSKPRRFEVAAAMNRLRILKIL